MRRRGCSLYLIMLSHACTQAFAFPPAARICAATSSSTSVLLAASTTLAPYSPNRRATPRPNPLEAPVTTIVLPAVCLRSALLSFEVAQLVRKPRMIRNVTLRQEKYASIIDVVKAWQKKLYHPEHLYLRSHGINSGKQIF